MEIVIKEKCLMGSGKDKGIANTLMGQAIQEDGLMMFGRV
jgi:hypothetical protein